MKIPESGTRGSADMISPAVFVLAMALLWLPSGNSQAQAPHVPDRQHILIVEEGEQCLYEIQGQPVDEQDVFQLQANGRLTLIGRGGVRAQIQIDDDPATGLPAVQHRPEVHLDRFSSIASRVARAPSGEALTEHKVNIRCCVGERGVGECDEWHDAMSRADLADTGAIPRDRSFAYPAIAGPFASELPGLKRGDVDTPVIPGGPVLQVAE